MELHKTKYVTINTTNLYNRVSEIAEKSKQNLLIISGDTLIKQKLKSARIMVKSPCLCGNYGDTSTAACVCTPEQIIAYKSKMQAEYQRYMSFDYVVCFRRDVVVNYADDTSKQLLKHAVSELQLTLSQIATIAECAETIAAMDNSEAVKPEHIAEAISYRYNL